MTRPTDELDLPVEQHPEGVGGVTLVEEDVALVEVHLLGHGDELEQLIVAEAVEQEEGTEVVDVQHQIVAR